MHVVKLVRLWTASWLSWALVELGKTLKTKTSPRVIWRGYKGLKRKISSVVVANKDNCLSGWLSLYQMRTKGELTAQFRMHEAKSGRNFETVTIK